MCECGSLSRDFLELQRLRQGSRSFMIVYQTANTLNTFSRFQINCTATALNKRSFFYKVSNGMAAGAPLSWGRYFFRLNICTNFTKFQFEITAIITICQGYLTLSRESGNIICIPLQNLSFLHDMMFKLDFKALYIYFVHTYLKKYMAGATATQIIVGSTSNRNGPEWAEMDRNELEWTEMEFLVSSVLEYKVYMKHKTYMKICIKPVFEGLSTVGQILSPLVLYRKLVVCYCTFTMSATGSTTCYCADKILG